MRGKDAKAIQFKKDNLFNKMSWNICVFISKTMNLNTCLTFYRKINFICIIEQIVKCNTTKLSEENREENVYVTMALVMHF